MTTSTESTDATLQQFFTAIGKTGKVIIRLLLPKDLDPHTAYDLGEKLKQDNFNLLGYKKDGKSFKSIQQGILDLSNLSYQALKHDGSPRGRRVINGIAELQNLNNRGFGIYFLANVGTGFNSADMTEGLCLFHESDKASIEEQQLEIDRITKEFGKPTAVIETGKSLHAYYRLTETLDRDLWPNYQRRWLQFSNCDDASLSNINRLMRVTGFNHVRWDKEHRRFVFKLCQTRQINPGVSYGSEQFDRVLPELDLNHWAVSVEQSNGDGFDMRSMVEYLEGYDPIGRRGWLTAKCPVHGGESMDSLHINQETGAFISHCGCESKDVFRETKILARAAGYTAEVSAKQQVVEEDQPDIINLSAIVSEDIRKIVESSTGSELSTKLMLYATENKFQQGVVVKLAEQIQEEIDQAEDDPTELKTSVDKKLEAISKDFPLSKLFPANIAEPLAEYCQGTAAPQGLMAMALITCLASLQHPKTNLICFGNTDRRAKPIFWLGVYGISGNGKTHSYAPPLKAVKNLGEEHNLSHNEKVNEWEAVQRKVKNKKPADIDPALLEQSEEPKPDRERYWVGDVTIEALLTRCAKQQDRGLLLYSPELLGWCLRMDPAKGEVEYWLSLWDGDSVEGDRIGREFPPLTNPSISVMGGVQPDVMSKLIAKGEDIQNGFMPRLALVRFEEVPKPPLSESKPPDYLELKKLFKAVADTKEPIEIKLDASCFSASDQWDREMDDRRLAESRKSIKPLFPKFNGYSYRIALMLHIINRAIDPSQTDNVPLSTFEAAIEFTRWLLGQSISVYEELLGDAKEDSIAKFLNSAKYAGWMTVRQFHKPNWRKFKTALDARKAIEEMINLGYIETNGEKITSKKFKFKSVDARKRGQVDRTPEMLASRRLESSTTNVDTVDSKSRSDHGSTVSDDIKSVDKFERNEDLNNVHTQEESTPEKMSTDLSTHLAAASNQGTERITADGNEGLSTVSTSHVDGLNAFTEIDTAFLSTCPRISDVHNYKTSTEKEQLNYIPMGEDEDDC
jgi:Protein of unknown function (DUF3987)